MKIIKYRFFSNEKRIEHHLKCKKEAHKEKMNKN